MWCAPTQVRSASVLHWRTSRLSQEELVELTDVVAALLPRPWTEPRGRPRALMLLQAAEATVIYQRRNHAQETVGEPYGISQPTVSRVISTLTALARVALESIGPRPGSGR